MTLDDAFNFVAEYDDANATHVKSGRRLGQEFAQDILRHANEELFELTCANEHSWGGQADEQLDELADTLSCLFHYAVNRNFSIDQVAKALKRKLELRFTKG